jgi:crotonobetainyl-CoA:carnitine CoA-transferase CaiB-like acyl-CoA transferase
MNWRGRPLTSHDWHGDWNYTIRPHEHAIAVMHALYHRERTGRGQRVGTAIINATLMLTSYALSLADGSAVERPQIDAGRRGLSALQGLYRLGDGEWACVAPERQLG